MHKHFAYERQIGVELAQIEAGIDGQRHEEGYDSVGQNFFGDAELGMREHDLVDAEHGHEHGRVAHIHALEYGQHVVEHDPLLQELEQLANAHQRADANLCNRFDFYTKTFSELVICVQLRGHAYAESGRLEAELAYARQELHLDGLGVEQVGKGGQRGQAQVLHLDALGLERATHHGQYVLLDVGGRRLAEYERHVADHAEHHLDGLLHLEDGLEARQYVTHVLVVGRLLGDEEDVGQEEGYHVRIDELLLETGYDALQVDALRQLVDDARQALEEVRLLQVVHLEGRVQVLERLDGHVVEERYLHHLAGVRPQLRIDVQQHLQVLLHLARHRRHLQVAVLSQLCI